MIENIIKNLETLRTLLAREAALARVAADLNTDNELTLTSFRSSAAVFVDSADYVAVPKSFSWTGKTSHAATSYDFDFTGRQLTSTVMEFVASTSVSV